MAANYISSSFIKGYSLSDTFITILDKFNNKTFVLSVCKYERSFVKGTKLNISQEDRSLITLEFQSNGDALSALQLLQNTMETLEPNCEIVASPGSLPVISSITYAQYKAMQAANTLVALQWYDVADLTSVFNLGSTLRLQAKTTNDYEPSGVVADSSNVSIKINCLDDTLQYLENSTKKLLATNKSLITADSSSTNISADNNSKVVSVASQYVSAYNKSFLTLDTCTYIVSFNSTLKLKNSSNCKFFDINLDLSSITAGFSDISVDKTDTIGKKGAQVNNISLASQTLHSYRDLTNIILNHDLLTQDQVITLDNEITQANGEFEFDIISSGTPSSHSVIIKDTSNNTLFTITNIQIGFSILFRYNKTTDLFEFISQNVIDLTGLATLVDLSNLHIQINNEKVIDVTYTQLNNLVTTQGIINGQLYRIKDFQTNYTQSVTGTSLTGSTEPLIVEGIIEKVNPVIPSTWVHKIGSRAVSELQPKDIILYDFYSGTKGTILYRKDPNKNVSAYYDFRSILFRRWQVGLEAAGSYSNITDNSGLFEDHLTFISTTTNIELGKPLTQAYPNIIFRGTCSNIFLKDRDIDNNYTGQSNIGWKEGISLNNSSFNYSTWASDTNNGATRSAIASLYSALIATDKYIEVRMSELYERIINSQISEGSMYKIIDYVDQPSSLPSYVQYPNPTTDQEKLLVFGIKNNEIFNRAMSENYPNDDLGIHIPTGSLTNIPNTQIIRSGLDGSTTVKNGITPTGNFVAHLNLINWSPEIWAAYRTGVMTEFGVIKDPGGMGQVITTIDFRNQSSDGPFTFQVGETYTFYFILSGVTRYSTTSLNPSSINPFTNYFVNLNPAISFRYDMSKNLFTWYDFRHLKFKRWETTLGSGNFTLLSDPGNGEASSFLLTFDNDINATNCNNIELGKPLSQTYSNIIFQGTNFNIFLKDIIINQSYISQSALGWKEGSPYATTSVPGIVQLANNSEVTTGTDAVKVITPATLVGGGYRRPRFFTLTGDNFTTDFVITHNIGNQRVMVQIYDNASPFNGISVPIKRTSTNTITVSFDTAPTSSENFTVMIL